MPTVVAFLIRVVLVVAIFLAPLYSFSRSSEDLAQDLNRQLTEITNTINRHRAEITDLTKKNRNLQEEVSLLDKKIENTELQMKAGEILIQQFKVQAATLRADIELLQEEISGEKEKLSQSIMQMYQLDQRSLVEVVFSGSEFSEFFSQFHYLTKLQDRIKTGLASLSQAKENLDAKEEDLNQRLLNQERLLALQNLQKEEIENNKRRKAMIIEKNVLTTVTLSQKNSALEEVARQLRQRLYVLKGLTNSVELDDAYKKATNVAGKVGIDPAFLMAILKVESDLGNNVGGGHWAKDMHPRDQGAFLQITKKLGLDPDKTPVSSKPRYGWGGAMGPAQFLPAVWLSYEARIAQMTGHNPPNPWDLEDAFAAAAIKLSKDGANQKTPEGEWGAAMKYFAGGNWKNPAYAFYGDRVMAVKDLIAQSFPLIK